MQIWVQRRAESQAGVAGWGYVLFMYLVLSCTSFPICFMLSVQKHIGISCSHCWWEFIVCWASNFLLIHHFYAHALKCIHAFWVIYLLIMEIHSLCTRFENAYYRMLRKSFYLNGCNVIIGWFLGGFIFWKYVSMMMVTLSLFGGRENFLFVLI
jgi:hypothetical protein